jgi:GNAT superfamily N-acetyltransferase
LVRIYGAASSEAPFEASDLAPPDGFFFVGYEDGAAVACGGFMRFDERTAELKRMYVVPHLRGRGHGRTLLLQLEAAARERGYEAARLETGKLEPAALQLYASAGYSPIPCWPPFAADEQSVCLEKLL